VFVNDHLFGGPVSVTANSTVDIGVLPLGAGLSTIRLYAVHAANDPSGSQAWAPLQLTLHAAGTVGASASFLRQDTATQGNWKGVYGADGYAMAYASPEVAAPSYASVAVTGAEWFWGNPGGDPRALQLPGASGGRVAATWYSSGTFTFDVNLTDGQ